jgi:hypothetical protein
MTPKFKNGAPLFQNGMPSFCCCPAADCDVLIVFNVRGGLIFGKMDADAVVSSFNGVAPGPFNELTYISGGFGESLIADIQDGLPHSIRVWATAADAGDIDINRITITVSGTACINGVTYTDEVVILDDLIPIIEDAGFPSDQSALPDGVIYEVACGACP